MYQADPPLFLLQMHFFNRATVYFNGLYTLGFA